MTRILIIFLLILPLLAQEHILTNKQRQTLKKIQENNKRRLEKIASEANYGRQIYRRNEKKYQREMQYYRQMVNKWERYEQNRDQELKSYHTAQMKELECDIKEVQFRARRETEAEYQRLSQSLSKRLNKIMQELKAKRKAAKEEEKNAKKRLNKRN